MRLKITKRLMKTRKLDLNGGMIKCERCENKGYYPAANGEDDFAFEFCTCAFGKEFSNDIHAMTAHND